MDKVSANKDNQDVILEAVNATNSNVLGCAGAYSVDQLYVSTATALGHAGYNAANNQQQLNTIAQAVTTMGVCMLYSIDAATITQKEN